MSLRAKIEAVIYTAEEPVTLAHLAGVFASEVPVREAAIQDEGDEARPSVEWLLEEGFVEANSLLNPEDDLAQVALLAGQEQRRQQDGAGDEAEARRLVRQRDREVREYLKSVLDELIEEYSSGDRGMEIREVAGGYRIATKPEYHDAVRSFVKRLKPPMKLSLQALETLAVIAYKQPVTAPEVSEIRGVDSGGVLGSLVSRKLITTAGRKQVIGRPILYKTTREFLLRFGLKDLNELPSIEEFEKLAGEIELGEEDRMQTGDTEQASTLPFQPVTEEQLEALDANAGEPGLAVEPVKDASSSVDLPDVVALDTTAPLPEAVDQIDVAAATHPTVPIESSEQEGDNEQDGRQS